MAKRRGAVLVFKKGTSQKQAAAVLQRIAKALDLGYYVKQEPADLVREFDDEWGGPVWYIP